MKNTIPTLLILFIIGFFILLSESSCKKNTIEKPKNTDSIIIKNNVFVIDSTILTLISTQDQLTQGIYIYTTNSSFPDFVESGILVGNTGKGYLRKINSISTQTGKVACNTSQACLEDVFQKGAFSFGSDFSALHRSSHKTTDNGFQFDLSNIILYQNGPLTITLTSGNISINPNWNMNYNIQDGTLTSFSAACQNGTMNANMGINITASGSVIVNHSDTLKQATSTTIKMVGYVPVVITTDMYLIMNITGTLNASINKNITITNSDSFNIGASYSNSCWQNNYTFSPTTTFNATPDSGQVGLTINCSLVPQMNIELYGIIGPYASIPYNEYLATNVASPALDWDYAAGLFLQPTIGIAGSILGHSLIDYNHSWNTDTISYKTPYQINKISGDNQLSSFGAQLPLPLKVQVLDNLGLAQSKVPVYFTISTGSGNVNTSSVLSDINGFAQTQWTLGSSGVQSVQTTVKIANGTFVKSAPLTFNAIGTIPTLAIGDTFGGGIVAYILQPGDPGYNASVQHGLIAATSDYNVGSTYLHWWNGDSLITGAIDTNIGSGLTNTDAIISVQGIGSYAASYCRALTFGGFSDWYLPSLDEFRKLFLMKSLIGGFKADGFWYWTSSEYSNTHAYVFRIGDGSQGPTTKFDNNSVRAVRSF